MIVLSASSSDDAVGHAFQNPLVLQQRADLKGVAQMLGGDVDAGERLASEAAQRPQRALHLHDVERTLAVRPAAVAAGTGNHRRTTVWVLPTISDTPTEKLQGYYRSDPNGNNRCQPAVPRRHLLTRIGTSAGGLWTRREGRSFSIWRDSMAARGRCGVAGPRRADFAAAAATARADAGQRGSPTRAFSLPAHRPAALLGSRRPGRGDFSQCRQRVDEIGVVRRAITPGRSFRGERPMFRAFFLAIGLYAFMLGLECLVLDKAVLHPTQRARRRSKSR